MRPAGTWSAGTTAGYLGAERVARTMELRDLPETSEEIRANMASSAPGPFPVKPGGE